MPVNHLLGLPGLKNTYYVMRHGHSQANAQGIIVSDPCDGQLGTWGLTAAGREQARAAAADSGLTAATVICSSGFSRARQTAETVREVLGAAPVRLAPELHERAFGGWDRSSDQNYERVWAADAGQEPADPGVEPVDAVLARTTALVAALEQAHRGASVLLVSHGDPLNILQAGFLRIAPARHRDLAPLATAEIRRLTLTAVRPA